VGGQKDKALGGEGSLPRVVENQSKVFTCYVKKELRPRAAKGRGGGQLRVGWGVKKAEYTLGRLALARAREPTQAWTISGKREPETLVHVTGRQGEMTRKRQLARNKGQEYREWEKL
jgi:hypothetical protein